MSTSIRWIRLSTLTAFLGTVYLSSVPLSEGAALQDKAKKNLAAKKETPMTIAGSTLGAGSFVGLAVDTPSGNRLTLIDPPPPTAASLPPANTAGLNAAQKKALQAARQKALAQIKEQANKPRRQVEFQIPEETPVRFMVLPEPFDEKGNLIKPTKAETDKLRGSDKSLPGFTGKLDQIRQGQVVRVDQKGDSKKGEVKMVVVLGEGNAPLEKQKDSQPNKKKK